MEDGRIVTLIGASLAKEGEEFFFVGVPEKCEKCKLKNTCMNLTVDRRYRIEQVRDKMKHDCCIHEGGVCVVEVIEPPIRVAIEAKYAFKKSKIVFESFDCGEKDCELYAYCHPTGLIAGDRCIILDVINGVTGECKKERALKIVDVQRERM